MQLTLSTYVFVLLSFLCFNCMHIESDLQEETAVIEAAQKTIVPHPYGGWYCPDNLNGFPPVNYNNWKNVPVITDRLPTKAETQTESSLIYINPGSYPNAKVYPMKLPHLAQVYSASTNRIEDIIIIQALTVKKDTIVGYRFLNGGNGSARLSEVTLLDEQTANSDQKGQFVNLSVTISRRQKDIWQQLEKSPKSKSILDQDSATPVMQVPYSPSERLSFNPDKKAEKTASYGDLLFGCYYIQNNYSSSAFAEKLLFLEDPKTQTTTLKLVAGPYTKDFNLYETKIKNWLETLKTQTENAIH